MIACFWVLMGFVGYVRSCTFWSSIAFILAIATRQYMLAFPVAIATYEFIIAIANARQSGRIVWKAQWSWIAPFMAACSILFWFYLFQGLAPPGAFRGERAVPVVQQTVGGIAPGGAIHFLSFVGLYIVIPEFLLFTPRAKLQALRQHWKHRRVKIGLIAASLLLFMLIFPPQEFASGNVAKIAKMLPYDSLRLGMYYVLALLACVRFSKFNLATLLIFFNALIMMKAHPWDRYVLPMVVAFWYLKSLDLVDQVHLPGTLGIHEGDAKSPASTV
jgi:hypothetical protein